MYKNIYEYIKKNMDHLHGDFTVAVTDMSEMEPDMLLMTIHPEGKDGETADFYMHADGRERFTKIIGDPMETQSLTFGQAIEAMKKGKKVARTGWNGKGMFLYLVDGSEVPFENLRDSAARFITEKSTGRNAAKICGHIDMKAADGSVVVGWLASQTDMLADDWEIVE